jgi:hypothetical protein
MARDSIEVRQYLEIAREGSELGLMDVPLGQVPQRMIRHAILVGCRTADSLGRLSGDRRTSTITGSIIRVQKQYLALVDKAAKFAEAQLPMFSIPSDRRRELVTQALNEAIELRYEMYTKRKGDRFRHFLWPTIRQHLILVAQFDQQYFPLDNRTRKEARRLVV